MLPSCVYSRQPLPVPTTNQKPRLPSSPYAAAAISISSPSHLQQIHAQLIKTNKPVSLPSLPDIALLCALSPDATFDYARVLLRRLSTKPEVFAWNTCLSALSESGSPIDAVRLFSRLRGADVLPDNFTLSYVLKACSSAPEVSVGRAVHGLVEKLGLCSDVYLVNAIVLMYASCGEMHDARLLFEKMPVRDIVSWNILINRYCKQREVARAKELFDAMPERNVWTWTSMIDGFAKCGNPKEAIHIFEAMEATGLKPNEVTVVAVLAACANLGALDLGKRVHQYSDRRGYRNNVRICNTLVDMYIKCGCLEIARRVFNEMEERTVVTWSAMIMGLAMYGHGEEALELFARMAKVGIRPNHVTFLGLVHACSHMGLLEEGRGFFTSMSKDYGIAPEIEHYGSMVDLLSRAGLLEEALAFISEMPIPPNAVVWGALLGGAKVHKNAEIGEEAIKHLRRLDPLNDGYYVVLSNIYAEAGRWDDAARVRRLMRDEGVKKTPGWSTISVDGVVHEFVAGDSAHPDVEKIYGKWDELVGQMKLRGYTPDTSAVLLDVEEYEKELVLHRHSEKLALSFGLLSTPPGTPIRIMKNLRVCSDCHAAFKLVSEISGRQIIVRDRNRFHCFREGYCSCRDYW